MVYKFGNDKLEKWFWALVLLSTLGMVIYLTVREARREEQEKKIEGFRSCH